MTKSTIMYTLDMTLDNTADPKQNLSLLNFALSKPQLASLLGYTSYNKYTLTQ